MKQFLLAILIILSGKTFSQTTSDTLNNASIIKLSKIKLPDNVILKKISQSICNFDLSVDALVKLKENSVSDRVINVMMTQQNQTAHVVTVSATINPIEQNPAFTESGIYFSKDAGYTSLDPTIVTPINPGTILFSVKYTFKIDGPEANYQIESKHPEFYFVFDTVKKSLNNPDTRTIVQDDYFYIDPLYHNVDYEYKTRNYQAISPNDFRLIKLGVDKTHSKREFATKKISALDEYDITIDSKYIIGFKYEKISGNTFKIKFDKELPPGEYCFFYSANNKVADCIEHYNQNTMKAFDFSIK
jgi:hypothetical protein